MIIAVGSQENNFISYFHYFLMNALSSVSSKVISLLIPITTTGLLSSILLNRDFFATNHFAPHTGRTFFIIIVFFFLLHG